MKVLELFGEGISNGGEEAFVVNMLEHMDRSSLTLDVLTPYSCNNNFYRDKIQAIGGKVFALGYTYTPGGLRTNIIRPLYAFLKEHYYDVVHIHSGSVSVLTAAAAVAKLCKVKKIIVHSHSSGVSKSLKYRLIKAISVPVLAVCADAYCACSIPAGEWKFSKRVVRKNLTIVPNGIDLNKFAFNSVSRQNIRCKLGLDENTLLVGHVGRFAPEKNHAFIIRVFEALHSVKKDSKLLLIGSGPLQDEIKLLVNNRGLDNDVIFLGNVNNVHDYLHAMDLFLFSSLHEGLPLVLVEAQASGVPIILSDAVTRDVQLVRNMNFISLNEPLQHWAESALNMAALPRESDTKTISEQGYDITATSAKIRNMYFN